MKLLNIAILLAFGAQAWAADPKAGKQAYDKSCRSCHGADGAPNATVAKMMKVEMLHLNDPKVQALSAGDMKNIILQGHGKMKAMPTLTSTADDIVAYVKTLKK